MEHTISFREKLLYGFGYLGMGLENTLVAAYLTLFATDALYIKASVVGVVILLPKLLDVVSDIFITNIIDRTDSRFGKYKPWLLSGIPLSLCLFLLFSCPSLLTTPTQNLLWITVIYFIMTPFFETMYWCPFLTLGTVISPNPEDRLDLSSIRAIFEQVAILAVSASCIPIVLRVGTSLHDVTGWRFAAALYAVLAVLFVLVCFFGVKERVKVNNKTSGGAELHLKEKLAVLRGNKALFRTILIMVVLNLPIYGYSILSSYFTIYVLRHEEWISPMSVIGIGFAILTSASVSRLARRFDRRSLIALGAVSVFLAGIVQFFVRGFLSGVVFLFFSEVGFLLVYVCIFSCAPDVVDYTKWKTGMDATGLINAVISSFQKLAAAFGAFFGSVVLTIGRYDPATAAESLFTQNVIRYGNAFSFLLGGVVIFICNHSFHELDRDRLKLYRGAAEVRE